MRGALENREQKPHPPVGFLQRPLLTEFDIELAGKGEICESIQLQLSQNRETKRGAGGQETIRRELAQGGCYNPRQYNTNNR